MSLRRIPLPNGCEIRVHDDGTEMLHYRLACGVEVDLADMYVERITQHRLLKKRGRDRAPKLVHHVFDVQSSQPRKGYATRLYEQAAKDACAAGTQLVSATRIASSPSNAFWAKQRAKRRAVKIGVVNGQDALAIKCGREADLSGCACNAPRALAGTKKRRR